MWDRLDDDFSRYPAQGRVARLMLQHGFRVEDGGLWAGTIALSDTAVARAAGVDRRVVKATVETIEEDEELLRVFARLTPTCHLREAAPAMGWGVLEIVPSDASQPGILSGVTRVVAERGISVRQAIVEDPELAHAPRLYIITENPIPAELLGEIQAVDGVREVVLGAKSEPR